MAKEIQFIGPTGAGCWVTVTDTDGLWYDPGSGLFVAYNEADFGDYDINATENGTSGFYTADMPTGLAAGVYNVVARTGTVLPSAVVVAVGQIDWDGSGVRGSGDANVEAIHATDLQGTGVVSDPWGPA